MTKTTFLAAFLSAALWIPAALADFSGSGTSSPLSDAWEMIEAGRDEGQERARVCLRLLTQDRLLQLNQACFFR